MITEYRIDLTTKCNGKCPICIRNTIPNLKIEDIDYNKLISFLSKDTLQQISRIVLGVSLGEPTLYPKVLEFYRYIKDSNPDIKLIIKTNGSTYTPEWWEKLGKLLAIYNNDQVIFAIDGTEKTHKLYRKLDFTKIFNNLFALQRVFNGVGVRTVLFDHNYDDIPNLQKILKPLNIEEHVIVNSFMYTENLKQPRDFNLCNTLIDINDNSFSPTCFDNLVINADGNITPCCTFPSYNGKPVFIMNHQSKLSQLFLLYGKYYKELTIDNTHLNIITHPFFKYIREHILDIPECHLCFSYARNN